MDQNVILVETVPLEFDLESLGCRLHIRPGPTKFMDRLRRRKLRAWLGPKPWLGCAA